LGWIQNTHGQFLGNLIQLFIIKPKVALQIEHGGRRALAIQPADNFSVIDVARLQVGFVRAGEDLQGHFVHVLDVLVLLEVETPEVPGERFAEVSVVFALDENHARIELGHFCVGERKGLGELLTAVAEVNGSLELDTDDSHTHEEQGQRQDNLQQHDSTLPVACVAGH